MTDAAALEGALIKASLDTGFRTEHLVENVTSQFIATITYGRELSPGTKIDVSYANDASLRARDREQFDVVPVTDERQNLDEGRPDGRGGWTLSWVWNVTPRATGSLTLELQIQPVVVMDGAIVAELARRNKPVPVTVLVHPNRPDFEAVATAVEQLELDVPSRLTVEEKVTVEAKLPLGGHGSNVGVDLGVEQGSGSVPVEVQEKSVSRSPDGDEVRGEWVVTPGKDGVARLTLVSVIRTEAGDRVLERRVERSVARVVERATELWPTVLAVVGGVTAVLVLLTTFATVSTQFRQPLVRAWQRVRSRRPPPEPPTPGYR